MVSDQDETHVEQSKFELGALPLPVDGGQLPWSHGDDRITAMVRDPSSAHLYWEITDEGIASARSRLGSGGPDGWCNLRIYDTTGRTFDGTNANDYFDWGASEQVAATHDGSGVDRGRDTERWAVRPGAK